MGAGTIRYDLIGKVAFVRMDDPATLNALGTTLGNGLREAIARAGDEARAIVIGSIGRAFCSGANLTEGSTDVAGTELDLGSQLEQTFNPLIREIRACPVPVITAVRGAAAGIGCGLALMGDLIVAGEGAYFYQAFRHVGLVPDGGSTYLLAKSIGRARAMEMMLLGEKLGAAKALEWGLINRVVPDDLVDDTALSIAAALADGPCSLGYLRDAAWAGLENSLDRQLDIERDRQRAAGLTRDFLEGVTAFREKRPPRFEGR
jgi:2-(1,2-epoxy-1,2-dihydrophenyl)acetyl-CoA isomerase